MCVRENETRKLYFFSKGPDQKFLTFLRKVRPDEWGREINLIHICIHRRLMSSCTCSAVTLSNLPVCLHLLPKGCLCWKERQISLKVKLHVPALCGICLLMKDNKKVLLAKMKVQKAKWLKAYYGNRHYQEITKIAQMSFKLREGYIKHLMMMSLKKETHRRY